MAHFKLFYTNELRLLNRSRMLATRNKRAPSEARRFCTLQIPRGAFPERNSEACV